MVWSVRLAGESEASILFDVDNETLILGIKWMPKEDTLTLVVQNNQPIKKLSKRSILSKIRRLYDPCGLVAPVPIRAKLLVQKLWKAKLNWDGPISEELANHWKSVWSRQCADSTMDWSAIGGEYAKAWLCWKRIRLLHLFAIYAKSNRNGTHRNHGSNGDHSTTNDHSRSNT